MVKIHRIVRFKHQTWEPENIPVFRLGVGLGGFAVISLPSKAAL